MILLIGGHIPKFSDRQKEYEYCLQKNLANPCVQRIYLFAEDREFEEKTDPELFRNEKLIIVHHFKRITFQELFTFANDYLNMLVAICNSDIFMDDSVGRLMNFDMVNVFIVLSRAFDVTKDSIIECTPARWGDSQDTWIYRTPIRIKNCDFGLGIKGCDNRLIYEARMAGYRVINPVTTIKTYHVHHSLYRTYDSVSPVPGPYQHCHDYTLS
jgi:hypothetical protein